MRKFWDSLKKDPKGIKSNCQALPTQQLQVATVEKFQLPFKIYPIKLEKPQQAFYIIDQKSNYINPLTQNPLTQDSNYYKYFEQAKALFKKPQRQNQNARIDRIESKINEIGQMTFQFRRIMLDNKKPIAKSNSTYRYFPLIPFQSQYASPNSDNNEDKECEYNENENRWYAPS
ncbi:hypothetical protein C2G38_2203380 [Gigaspora rosea]|uniref:Uncharacterized protein n=1 Tax=Gigaspora rosea TaxID=44941 RepID=A0A397UMI8_9GLOM|nr:hypothetical protein C2G38_2203380 [Gigaspora rosea]